MLVCVGWCVKWNSLWRYTTLPSYNFIEWMISMIVTVRLWRHSNIVRIRRDLYISNSLTTHDQEVVGLNPGTDILDGCKRCCSHYIKENTEIKVAKWDPPKHFFTNLINYLKDLLASIPPFGSFFAISKLSGLKGETQSV